MTSGYYIGIFNCMIIISGLGSHYGKTHFFHLWAVAVALAMAFTASATFTALAG
jgi:hypothetical protein